MKDVCVYCRGRRRDHDPSPHGGPCWLLCRDGTGRPVHLDTHFRTPPGWRWAGEPHAGRGADWLLTRVLG